MILLFSKYIYIVNLFSLIDFFLTDIKIYNNSFKYIEVNATKDQAKRYLVRNYTLYSTYHQRFIQAILLGPV